MTQHFIFRVQLGIPLTIVSLDDGSDVGFPRFVNQVSRLKPIKSDVGMDERNGLQREIWKARRVARSHFGCGYRIKEQSAEAVTSNELCSQLT
jgi:hypothetical protein